MKLTIVYETTNRMDAEVISGMLEAQDIPTVLACDDAAGLYPGMELYFGCKILVHEENLQKSIDIIQGIPETDS
jgi:hypothetical protein